MNCIRRRSGPCVLVLTTAVAAGCGSSASHAKPTPVLDAGAEDANGDGHAPAAIFYVEHDAGANIRLIPIGQDDTKLVLALEIHGLADVHGLGLRLRTDRSQLAFRGMEPAGVLGAGKAGFALGHAFDSGEVWVGAATRGQTAVDATQGARVALLTFDRLGDQCLPVR